MENRRDMISGYYDEGKTNFFKVEEEFFIIDSEHLADVKTKLYGYSVQCTGIYENENLTAEAVAGLDGTGAYIYVECCEKDGVIKIRQDYMGSYGLYLFYNQGYFAISNSFFRLLEYVKYRFQLSLNRDYANHLLLMQLASVSCQETPIKEICLVDKNAVVLIDEKHCNLRFDWIDYQNGSLSVDSQKGMEILDRWYQKWVSIFRSLRTKTNQISADLSGGFDSRLPFLLLLKSGIDLDEIRVKSLQDDLHTHSEDYAVASEIAEYFGFALNHGTFSPEALHYSLADVFNMAFYVKMTFHKEMYFKCHRFAEKRFVISGAGGEAVRAHWDVASQNFISQMTKTSSRYSDMVKREVTESTERIIQSSYEFVRKKYRTDETKSDKLSFYLYGESRCRAHFGKGMVEDFFSNTCVLAPLLDPDLAKLRRYTDDCGDKNLLMALIYERYCPELLNFRFEGNRSIKAETIQVATEINERFPLNVDILSGENVGEELFDVILKDSRVTDIIGNGKNNRSLPGTVPDQYLMTVFDSAGCRRLFTSQFDKELYLYAKKSADKENYHPMRECYAVVGLASVIERIAEGNFIRNSSIISSLDTFICQNEFERRGASDQSARIGRIDIRLEGEQANCELISISDRQAHVSTPMWLQKDGMGYVIEAEKGTLDLTVQVNTEGKLLICLRGMDVRDLNGNRVPYWIDFLNFEWNREKILKGTETVCHDRPFRYARMVRAGEIITMHTEWTTHGFAMYGLNYCVDSMRSDNILRKTNQQLEEQKGIIQRQNQQLEKQKEIIQELNQRLKEAEKDKEKIETQKIDRNKLSHGDILKKIRDKIWRG